MTRRPLAPLDGTLRTPLQFLDFQTQYNPGLPFALYPSPSDPAKVTSVAFAQMSTASNIVAHLLRPGRLGLEDEVVAVILNTDSILYIAVALGMMRAGFVVSSRSA